MAKFQEFEQWRKKSGLTQANLGLKLIPPRTQNQISDWEKGMRPIPADALEQLRAMGYTGPAEILAQPISRADMEELLSAAVAKLVAEMRAILREQKRGPS